MFQWQHEPHSKDFNLLDASYGDSDSLSVSYNQRLLPTSMTVTNIISKNYEYYADGRLKYSQNVGLGKFDRSYAYDHAGRMIEALSGPAARGEADVDNRPYKLSYAYDALNHLTETGGRLWSAPHEMLTGSGVYVNDKNTGWQYDADGRLTSAVETLYTYDGAGRAVQVRSGMGDLRQEQVFDGDGVRTKLKSEQDVYHEDTDKTTTETMTQYFVTSSVLNTVVTELDEGGRKTRTFVYEGSKVLAWQQKSYATQTQAETKAVTWEHRDASNTSVRGAAVAELEPLGMNAGVMNPFPRTSTRPPLSEARTYPGFGGLGSGLCRIDRIDVPCDIVQNLMRAGATAYQSVVLSEGTKKPAPRPTPGLNRFAAPSVRNLYGNRPWAQSGNGAIFFSSSANQFAGQSVTGRADSQNSTFPPPTITDLRADVEQLLRKPECARFVKDILNTVHKEFRHQPLFSDDALTLFDTINGQGGFKFEQAIAGDKPVLGRASGYIDNLPGPNNTTPGQRMATVTITPLPREGPSTPWRENNARIYYGLVALGEITHHAGSYNYSDRMLALAASAVSGIPGLPLNEDADENSNYYHHKVLNIICDPRRK